MTAANSKRNRTIAERLRNDRSVTLQEIADDLGISKQRVGKIAVSELGKNWRTEYPRERSGTGYLWCMAGHLFSRSPALTTSGDRVTYCPTHKGRGLRYGMLAGKPVSVYAGRTRLPVEAGRLEAANGITPNEYTPDTFPLYDEAGSMSRLSVIRANAGPPRRRRRQEYPRAVSDFMDEQRRGMMHESVIVDELTFGGPSETEESVWAEAAERWRMLHDYDELVQNQDTVEELS